eukprot:3016579-Pyramimonas_sp.AAC.1
MFDCDSDLMGHLIRFLKVLDKTFTGWKQDMSTRSRYYSINTSPLVPRPRWTFRGVSNMYWFLQSPMRNAQQAAAHFDKGIPESG